MLRNFREISKSWVFSAETTPSFPLGKVVDIVVDPYSGHCVALWVKTLDGLRLLDFRDIQKWKSREIFASAQKDILKPEEFPRLKPILEREVRIIGADVWAHNGLEKKKIGVVEDFMIETSFPVILSIKVNTGWWIFGKKIEIPRKRILQITEEGILVSDNTSIQVKDADSAIVFQSTK